MQCELYNSICLIAILINSNINILFIFNSLRSFQTQASVLHDSSIYVQINFITFICIRKYLITVLIIEVFKFSQKTSALKFCFKCREIHSSQWNRYFMYFITLFFPTFVNMTQCQCPLKWMCIPLKILTALLGQIAFAQIRHLGITKD